MTGTSSACPAQTLMVRGSHDTRVGKHSDSAGRDADQCSGSPGHRNTHPDSEPASEGGPYRPNSMLYFGTTRLFFTENTFGTPFARRPARFLSVSLSATPSRLTFPFFTMIWIEGTAESA